MRNVMGRWMSPGALPLVVALFLGQPVALGETLTTEISISGNINGETLAATGTSTLDLDLGDAHTEILFTSIPTGFDVVAYGNAWKTKHHPKNAILVLIPGVANFDQLSPAGYSFATTSVYDGGVGSLVSTGEVVPTDRATDRYTLDIQGSYSGPLGAVGVEAHGASFGNVAGVPGDIYMYDTETITFGGDNTLGVTETGTFTLFSGASLQRDPQPMDFGPVNIAFNAGTGLLTLDTWAAFLPEPTSFVLFLFVAACTVRRRPTRISR